MPEAPAPEPLCWIAGHILPEREAVIPARDRAVERGYGAFETVLVARGRPFRLDDHQARLYAALDALRIARPEADVEAAAAALLAPWGRRDGVLRIVVTGGNPPDLAPTLLLTVSPPRALPGDARERGIALWVAPWPSPSPTSPLAGRKTTSYLDRALAREEARARGAWEALFLDASGLVVEGAGSNVFWAREGALRTPHTSVGLLAGITRAIVLGAATEAGLRVEAGRYALDDLLGASEVFITSSLMGVLPVREVRGAALPVAWAAPGNGGPAACPGPVTRDLAARLEALVAAECP